jgi:hypothetical protein
MASFRKILIFLLFSLPLHLSAEEIALFNGEDLARWKIENGTSRDIRVADKCVVFDNDSYAPTWLRSVDEFENFGLSFEYNLNEWCAFGVFLHAPLFGEPTWCGFNIRLNPDTGGVGPWATGAVFPVVASIAAAGNGHGQWNTCKINFDWPLLEVRVNEILVQRCQLDSFPELTFRLKQGHLGFQALAHGAKIKNIRIKKIARTTHWKYLFDGQSLVGWNRIGEAQWRILPDGILQARNGNGYLISNETFLDFEFRTYVRCKNGTNGGIFFRWVSLENNDRGYEIQIEELQDSKDPTGSLYYYQRANRPRVRPEEWFLMQVYFKKNHCVVRVNGETVVDYPNLEKLRPGFIALQMHRPDSWIEFKDLRMHALTEEK